jgi:hypothetical protein
MSNPKINSSKPNGIVMASAIKAEMEAANKERRACRSSNVIAAFHKNSTSKLSDDQVNELFEFVFDHVRELTGARIISNPMSAAETKQCRECQQVKPLAEYYRNGKRRRTECKTCSGTMNAPRYRTEIYQAQKQDWYYAHRDEHIERSLKNRIERKFPYLRSEEYKQSSIERYERHHRSPVLSKKTLRVLKAVTQ